MRAFFLEYSEILLEKEKKSIFSFSNYVFKRPLSQSHNKERCVLKGQGKIKILFKPMEYEKEHFYLNNFSYFENLTKRGVLRDTNCMQGEVNEGKQLLPF